MKRSIFAAIASARRRTDSAIAFDPAATNSNVTLSNGNRTATRTTGSGDGGVARAFGGKSTGKWYVEFVVGAGSPAKAFGLVLAAFLPLTSVYLGQNTNGWGYWNSGNRFFNNASTAGFSSFTTGDVIGMAWDADAGKIWFSKNNTWQGSGDPAAGTNPSYSSVSGTGYPAADVYDSTAIGSIRAPSSNTGTTPSGFTNWTP